MALLGPLLVLSAVLGYYYVAFSKMIDARIHGEMQRVDPRVFARPFQLRRGQSTSQLELIERLNELGYAHRARAEQPGEFTIGRDTIVFIPRDGDRKGNTVRVVFTGRTQKREPSTVGKLEIIGSKAGTSSVTLDPPLITALVQTGREKRRDVPLQVIPQRMVQAVLAIEDRRFYEHPGVDLIGTVRAVFTNLFDDKPYLEGGSTLTQQIVKNTFLTPEKSLRRKTLEWFMSVVLEQQLSKDQILELYLNDVSLGQRGSFAVHGVGEAARLFFAKDIANVSLSEAATIAGVIQSPSRLSPFNHAERARERRNLVLRAMAEAGFVSADAADRASREPLQLAARALDSEAPYFVDHVSKQLQEEYRSVASAVDVYTTLDLHLQRVAQDAVRAGIVRLDDMLKRRRRRPQVALIAVDPGTGEVLALVGGRSYNQSQFNRATDARRQPGSVFKPFVYLAAFEHAFEEGRTDLTPASVVVDEPTTWVVNDQDWSPANYEGEYDGPITLRRALALSRNIAAIKIAESTGYGEVASFWRRVGAGTPPRPYPSIALGVFEVTPLEVAQAFTLFPNGGTIRPLRSVLRLVAGGRDVQVKTTAPRTIARPETTFLLTNMMRSVMNEGTGAGARAAGFSIDAAGKSGTTNDLRDAWFVGFTPELLTVVWVGMDDNQPVGLSGSQAALPIWTTFMSKALAGRESTSFQTPAGITFLDIDRDTGRVAGPLCPRIFSEAFIAGTEPTEACSLHSWW
ncbi:MAG TPA: PBP1A family penicillin-binding protein [Vicinamibacterales bacterium]|nr:PBP1A family penicillin-binding protein [Vicinamibacterales bacterium]